MKKLFLSVGIAALLSTAACSSFSNRGEIDNPYIESASSMHLSFDKVVLTDSTTVLSGKIIQRGGTSFRIDSACAISAGGNEYRIVAADGFAIGADCVMPDSAVLHFAMKFPPVPASVKEMDFADNSNNGWRIWGIQLDTNYVYQTEIPASLTKLDADATLPQDVLVSDTTTVNIKMLNYRPDMGSKLKCFVNTLYGNSTDVSSITLDENGTATFKKLLVGPEEFVVNILGDMWIMGSTLMLPGETIDLVVDCRFSGVYNMRQRDRFQEQTGVEYDGSNGKLDKIRRAAIKDCNYLFNMSKLGDYHMNGDEYTDFVIKAYQAKLDSINATDVAPAVKEFSTLCLQSNLIRAMAYARSILNSDYMVKHQLWGTPAPDDSIKVEITPEHARKAAALVDINNPKLLLAYNNIRPRFLVNTDVWNNAGIDTPLLTALADYAKAYQGATAGKLDEALVESLKASQYPIFAEAAQTRLAEIESMLKSKAVEMIEATPDVADDKVFEEIIKPYKGKVVVVDLWNTWCAPCRAAIADNEPLKSSELSSDDIVWIYIADESSPIGLYLKMIADIKGHHFRLSDAQIRKIREHFNVDGIPYYIIVDREGNAAGRPDLRDHSLYVSTILGKL